MQIPDTYIILHFNNHALVFTFIDQRPDEIPAAQPLPRIAQGIQCNNNYYDNYCLNY